jgi:hypothetical protein
MLDYHAAGRKGGNPVKRAALVKLESLLHDVSTEELGPSNRARALLQSIRAESEVPNVNPGERVAEALKLAPSDPGVLSYAAERSLMLTQGTPPKTGDRARSLIAQSCDHALAGLRVAEQFEYDTVSTKGPLCFDLRKQSVRALTLAGRDKEARAIVDGLERLTGGRPSQTETLLRLIRDGKSRRKLLFPDGNF